MYRTLVTECAAQHRRFSYDVRHLKDICEYPDGSSCAICESVSFNTKFQIMHFCMLTSFKHSKAVKPLGG